MSLSSSMEKVLNEQIQTELYSSYLYLSMSAYCSEIGFHGFAHWMKEQSKEEWAHGLKIYDYIIERGGKIDLKEIKKPPQKFNSLTDMMQQTLKHEQGVSKRINDLYETAGKTKDHATQIMMQWFVTEQVEEEAQINDILQKMDKIAKTSSGIFYLDKEMGKRGLEKI